MSRRFGISDTDYCVCDRCGLFWEIDSCSADPDECPGCDHGALWRFPSVEAAWEHSDTILARNRASS